MTIEVKNLRKPGVFYDSTKLGILSNMISGSVRERTRGTYIVKSKIEGHKLVLTILQLNPETNKYSPVLKDEQSILVGRISNFLQQQGISADVVVV